MEEYAFREMNGLRRCLIRVLILYLLVLMPGGGLVLCWGADGHVAIERAGEKGNRCEPPAPVRGADPLHRWSDPSQTCLCQPCRDVPLTLALGIEIARPGHGQSQLDNTRNGHALVLPKIHFEVSSENRARASAPVNKKIPILSHLQTACLRN